MEDILLLDKLGKKASLSLGENYRLTNEAKNYRAIILRSTDIHTFKFSESLLCVGRAGAGTNNIPVAELAEKGVVVFNAPGANANAVKELVIASLFISSRNLLSANAWVNGLKENELSVAKQAEKGKSAFSGSEIAGKTLCVYGLGAIGKKVALSAKALGMNVIGYDPYLSDYAKEELKGITLADDKETLIKYANFLTLHVPLTPETQNFICEKTISSMKSGATIINLARGELVDKKAVLEAVKSGKIFRYVTDFADESLLNNPHIIVFPHLGASTAEAEDNCAVMTCNEIVDFLENGNIKNSVNFPDVSASKKGYRLLVLFKGENTADKISANLIGKDNYAHSAMKKNYGAMIIDTDTPLDENIYNAIINTDGVLKTRIL